MRSIHGSTKETDMFREFHATLLETQLDPSKLFAVVTDRCPSTLGQIKDFQNSKTSGVKKMTFAPVTGIIAFCTKKVLLLSLWTCLM